LALTRVVNSRRQGVAPVCSFLFTVDRVFFGISLMSYNSHHKSLTLTLYSNIYHTLLLMTISCFFSCYSRPAPCPALHTPLLYLTMSPYCPPFLPFTPLFSVLFAVDRLFSFFSEVFERYRSKISPVEKPRSKLANLVELSWGFDRGC